MKVRPAMSMRARAASPCPMRWSRLTWSSATRNVATTCLRSRGSSIVVLDQSSGADYAGALALLPGELVDEVPVDRGPKRPNRFVDDRLLSEAPAARCREVEEGLLGRCRPARPELGVGALNVERGDIAFDEQDMPAEHVQVRPLLRDGDDGRGDLAWDRAEPAGRADVDECRVIDPVVGLGDP